MFNPQYDWLSCKLRTIPIIDIYKSISENCHLGHTFGSYLHEYLDTQLWACLCLLKTLAANIMTQMIHTLEENPVVEQNTLFSCPTLYMFYLEIINPERLLDIFSIFSSLQKHLYNQFFWRFIEYMTWPEILYKSMRTSVGSIVTAANPWPS